MSWFNEADMIVAHAKIYTVDTDIDRIKAGDYSFPVIEDGGVAVKDGKIIFVGKAEDVSGFAGEHTKLIDASGKILVPGFCDSHMHSQETGLGMSGIDLLGVHSKEEMLAAIQDYAKTLAPGKWILGNNCWNEQLWDIPELPTCHDLDKAAPDNPCYVIRYCHHLAAANTAAMRAAGISRDTPDPTGGFIDHFDNGEPNGLFYEQAAFCMVEKPITSIYAGLAELNTDPEKTGEAGFVASIETVGKLLSAYGITSTIDTNVSNAQLRAYERALKEGKLKYRANLMYFLNIVDGDAKRHCAKVVDDLPIVTGFGNDMVKFNGLKVLYDGMLDIFTAAMRAPYPQRPDSLGMTVWTPEDLELMAVTATTNGWQFGVHTIGDRAADEALAAFEAADAVSPIKDKRFFLIHDFFPHEDQLATMRRMNVGAALQPSLLARISFDSKQWCEDMPLGHGAGMFFSAGVICGGSSDSPVSDPSVIEGIYYTVSGKDISGRIMLNEESRISPVQALVMWTKNSAYLLNSDDSLGSIAEGYLADMVIIDRDFLSGGIEDIPKAKIDTTILGGQIVYQA